jgi:hypothetical protein
MEMSSISRTNSRVREADRSVMRRAVATRNGAAVESRRARVHAQPEWGRRTWRLDPYNGRASRRRRPRRCASSAEEPKPWAALVLWAGDTDGGLRRLHGGGGAISPEADSVGICSKTPLVWIVTISRDPNIFHKPPLINRDWRLRISPTV